MLGKGGRNGLVYPCDEKGEAGGKHGDAVFLRLSLDKARLRGKEAFSALAKGFLSPQQNTSLAYER